MPVYNYGQFVAETVESIWNQTHSNFEIIAVDDGSTDNSLEILQDLAARSNRPMEVFQTEHVGVSGAMNTALKVARGEFVAVVHADDVHLPTKLEKQVHALLANPSATIVHTEYRCIDEMGRDLGIGSRESDLPPARGACLRQILGLQADIRSVSIMFRRKVLTQLGGYDPMLPYEDWQSILRLASAGEVSHIDEDLVLRRIHGHNQHINITKFPRFSLDQIAPKVLLEVMPSDLDENRLFSIHIGSIVASSIGSGNIGKGLGAFSFAIRKFGIGQLPNQLTAVIRGLRSFIWLRLVHPITSPRVRRMIRKSRSKVRNIWD